MAHSPPCSPQQHRLLLPLAWDLRANPWHCTTETVKALTRSRFMGSASKGSLISEEPLRIQGPTDHAFLTHLGKAHCCAGTCSRSSTCPPGRGALPGVSPPGWLVSRVAQLRAAGETPVIETAVTLAFRSQNTRLLTPRMCVSNRHSADPVSHGDCTTGPFTGGRTWDSPPPTLDVWMGSELSALSVLASRKRMTSHTRWMPVTYTVRCHTRCLH